MGLDLLQSVDASLVEVDVVAGLGVVVEDLHAVSGPAA